MTLSIQQLCFRVISEFSYFVTRCFRCKSELVYPDHVVIRALPLIAAGLPIVGVTAAYWVNIHAGVLPSCNPFIDGCTSISATGRYAPGSLAFRAALLPHAVILSVLWWVGATSSRIGNVIRVCGITGAVALLLYVIFLGTEHPFYEFMRRFGIYFYFLGTVTAQLALTLSLHRSRRTQVMMSVAIAPFLLGILNLMQKTLLSGSGNFQNRIEWIAALLMQFWFVLLFLTWRRS